MNRHPKRPPRLANAGMLGKVVAHREPMSYPVGSTTIRCSCGRIAAVPTIALLREGWTCPCGGLAIPAAGAMTPGERSRAALRMPARRAQRRKGASGAGRRGGDKDREENA